MPPYGRIRVSCKSSTGLKDRLSPELNRNLIDWFAPLSNTIGGMYNMPVSTMVSQPEIGAQGFHPEKMNTDYRLPVQGAIIKYNRTLCGRFPSQLKETRSIIAVWHVHLWKDLLLMRFERLWRRGPKI